MSKFEPDRQKKVQSKFQSKFGSSASGSKPGTVDGSSPSTGGTPMGLLLVLTYPT
jgi:hypothetical protein